MKSYISAAFIGSVAATSGISRSSGGMQAGGIINGGMSTGATGTENTFDNSMNVTLTSTGAGNAVSAVGVPAGQNPFFAVAGAKAMDFPQLTDTQKAGLQMAVTLWAQDTTVVSSALALLKNGDMSEQDFRDTADMAYMAEVNELMQKNYIDALLSTMPQLQAASTSLGNGSFAIVVDQLREMRIRGPANKTFVNAAVDSMNSLRCRQVLLAIDTYLQTANLAAGNTSFVSSTRPPACASLYAQTADILSTRQIVNVTTFPTASQLISQYNQAPRFQLSNIVGFSKNSGNDNTPALGSQFTAQYPFTNTSSLAGQLQAFNGQPYMTNGPANNFKANPLNADLFPNIGSGNNNNNGNSGSDSSSSSSDSSSNSGSDSSSNSQKTPKGAKGASGRMFA